MNNDTPALRRSFALAALLFGLAACGGGGSRESDPPAERLPNAASLIPTAPAPQPSATPSEPPPPEDPWPANPGGGAGGGGGSSADCGDPAPPALATVAIKVHGGSGDRVLLDSTPLVGPDAAFCKRIGYTDGRSYCPVRTEGSPERVACEAARVGRASDTGRVGPTWSVDGRACDGYGDVTSCVNHPTNQFQAYAYGPGTFRACGANGACGEIRLP